MKSQFASQLNRPFGEKVDPEKKLFMLTQQQNAEIGLGTIYSLQSAKKWLAGTFLSVRLRQNPNYYKINGDTSGLCFDDRLEHICQQGIDLLQANRLVSLGADFESTEFGQAMARYYVRFGTMQHLLKLKQNAKISEIVSCV